MYNKCMYIEYDAEKDLLNQTKHGISFSFASHLDWSTLWAFSDDRMDYGEFRMIGVVYTDREDTR